ncbi:MAG: DUF2239 family protein [Chlorobiaceae bacterium]|nr:DUF2239 family protein [Chlorobiaceae bacterium]NTW10608.1 DUF2239 family protein [Chlorobiaceae bacterium]
MTRQNSGHCTAFDGMRAIASGDLPEVAVKVKMLIDQGEALSVLIFEDVSSELVEVDFRGTPDDVLKRLEQRCVSMESTSEALKSEPEQRQGPGRPKLGVVPREVTLLPRHWEWLNRQPGGASVALRKLVEDARKINSDQDKLRSSQESLYRFMSAMAGDLPGFEEATRAIFARDAEQFNERVALWPPDIRDHIRKLSLSAFRMYT